MTRPLRIEFAGAFYHVVSRGNARQMVFKEATDFAGFVDLLGEVCTRFEWHCHAYCVMGNHYHLVVETRLANLGLGMRHLNGVFTQRYNKRHGRVGHVFQGRYKASLVQEERYLVELARYVVLNPVRAGIARRAADWPWSAWPWLAGERAAPRWAQPARVWQALHADPGEARRRFAALVAEGMGERVPGWSRDGILGTEEYRARLGRFLATQRGAEGTSLQARLADRPPLERLVGDVARRAELTERDARIAEAVLRWR